MNRTAYIIIGIAAVVAAIALLIAGLALSSRTSEANARRHDQAEAWHKVICFSEVQVKKNVTDPAKRRTALNFYNEILRLVDAPPCTRGAH